MKTNQKHSCWIIGKELKETLDKLPIPQEHKMLLVHDWEKPFNMDYENLCFCMRFYELYPDFKQVEETISREHYAVLVTIQKGWKRNFYEKKVFEQKLSVQELISIIQKDKSEREQKSKTTSSKIPIERIEPFIYRLQKIRDQISVDVGFLASKVITIKELPKSEFVKVEEIDDSYKVTAVDKVAKPHYIYKASVSKILDGDVLELHINTGLGLSMTREVRLRGIYSKPMETEHKQTAKEYIEECLKDCKFIAVRTYWQENFENYLADIFYDKDITDYVELIKTGTFLNQELLDNGLALRY